MCKVNYISITLKKKTQTLLLQSLTPIEAVCVQWAIPNILGA